MTTKKLITSDDPKGRQTTDLFRGAYNKARLTEEQAQYLNENRGSEFTTELLRLIQRHSSTDQYANDVASSDYTYPKEYKGPKPIAEQVKTIATMFGLDPTAALAFAKNLPTLPVGAEGWFAIPKVSPIVTKEMPYITDKAEQYCEGVMLVCTKLAKSRSFLNFIEGDIVPQKLRQHARTINFLENLEAEQTGDILIIAAQFGRCHRGKSVRRVRKILKSNEFGLGAFATGCMALIHPERYSDSSERNLFGTYCIGDDFDYSNRKGTFLDVPLFSYKNKLCISHNSISSFPCAYGSVSAFVPQN